MHRRLLKLLNYVNVVISQKNINLVKYLIEDRTFSNENENNKNSGDEHKY